MFEHATQNAQQSQCRRVEVSLCKSESARSSDSSTVRCVVSSNAKIDIYANKHCAATLETSSMDDGIAEAFAARRYALRAQRVDGIHALGAHSAP